MPKGDKKTVLERIGDVLEDVQDVFALGRQITRDISELAKGETSRELSEESEERAVTIRKSRKKKEEK